MAGAGRTATLKRPPARATSKKPERRTNADRSATTRKQILDATVHCFEAWGYGGVTNMKVADAAGVSRGAMMHHFPTRQALIVATVEYAYKKLSEFRSAELMKVAPGLPRYRKIVDIAIDTNRTPEGMTCNEIRIGSRSDPEIRDAVTPIMSFISDDYGRVVSRLAREAGLTPTRELQGLTGVIAMSTRALAINTFTYPSKQTTENVLWMLRSMREDLIARQLGERVAERPAPLEETRPPPKPRKRT